MSIKGIVTAFRYVQTALVAIPALFALIVKIRAAFGSDKVQEALKAIGVLIDKIAPPVPTADSTGSTPTNPEREKRRRFTRFMNRTRLAGQVPDNEVQNICAKNLIQPYVE